LEILPEIFQPEDDGVAWPETERTLTLALGLQRMPA
jgi:hypothetical protein